MLEVPIKFPYTDRMKNKNNVTVTELVNKLIEVQRAKNNRDHAHAYALGCVQAILDWEVKGFNKGFRTLQEAINSSYESAQKELDEVEAEENGLAIAV